MRHLVEDTRRREERDRAHLAVQRPDDPFVFHSPRGGELRNGSLFYAWREVRSTAGIPIARADAGRRNIRFHDLRHFFAYRLKEQGQDPYTIFKPDGGDFAHISRFSDPWPDPRARFQS